MTVIVPLTGSMVAGPLGVVHLPRMWQKGLLKTIGVLPDDYVFAERGFDQRMMEGIGVDAAAFVPFLESLPTYLETEAWVRKNATKLDGADDINAFILNRNMSSEFAQKMRERCGIADANFGSGTRLNNLDDLASLHEFVVAHRGQKVAPISPAVSSLLEGPLGVQHLPRLWAKAMIKTLDALPEGYHSGSGPLDEQVSDVIGMDLAAAVKYIAAELPTYIAFEAWVRKNATKLNAESIGPWNERLGIREKPEHVAAPERALLGMTDEKERRGVLLNDMVDWYYFHEDVKAAQGTAAN